MADIFNILVVGVGGQGVVLLGNLLRQFGLNSPFIKNVVGTETRGVSQREGSVIATTRYLIDSKIYNLDQGYEIDDLISPSIPINDAHIVLGLEPLETIRNLKYISEQTVVVLNTSRRYPRDVVIKKGSNKLYPPTARILEILDQFARKTVSMDFSRLSISEFGNSIYANTIILGVATKEFENVFIKENFLQILKDNLKPIGANIEAFELGYNLI